MRVADSHLAGPGRARTDGDASPPAACRRRARRSGAGGACGGDAHHIVDPSTGAPAAEYWRTVSVAAATCVDANVASTAAIVMGAPARAWLDDAGLPARLVTAAGDVAVTGAWPAERAVAA